MLRPRGYPAVSWKYERPGRFLCDPPAARTDILAGMSGESTGFWSSVKSRRIQVESSYRSQSVMHSLRDFLLSPVPSIFISHCLQNLSFADPSFSGFWELDVFPICQLRMKPDGFCISGLCASRGMTFCLFRKDLFSPFINVGLEIDLTPESFELEVL